MSSEDTETYKQLMQMQIASAEASLHLLQQESFGFRTVAGKAVRQAFGLSTATPTKEVIKVLEEFIQALHDEIATCQ